MVSIPPQPSQSSNYSGRSSVPEISPVFALKELVARLHREQRKIQDLLSSLGFALRSFNNLNQFLELVPLMASRVTDAEGGALVLFKPDGKMRLERLHCQDRHHCQDIRLALEAATRQVSASGSTPVKEKRIKLPEEPILALDRQVSRYLGADVQLFGTAVIAKNREQGRLYVFSREPNYAWTDNRQKLVRLIADQTAVAIENDQLTSELRQKERMDRELEIGAEIQLQLLPRQYPQIKGLELAAHCKTANRVGGDYYDFIPASYAQLDPSYSEENGNGHWGIAIGDVMGKGVPAGLIMTMVRGMLRAEVLNGHSPAQILHHLNHVMQVDLENSNRFVTLFYSAYDPTTRILSYSNAAHNPPLLWHAATNTLERLDTLGMLIGLDVESQYHDGQVQLDPGDTLLYYTDGFTDAANRSGDRFDEERLVDAFQWACRNCENSTAILNYLFDLLQRFIGSDQHNEDDMTLIVMRVMADSSSL